MKTDPSNNSRSSIAGRLLLCVLMPVLVLAIIIAGYRLLYASAPRSAYVFELGETIETDPSYYLDAGPLALLLSSADFSRVDMSRPGVYPMEIRYLRIDFSYDIAIADTIPPEILVYDKPLYFVQGTELQPDDLIESVVDADSEVETIFNTDLMEKSSLSCEFTGSYCAWIIATDSSGNSSKCSVDYIVDLAPEFGELRDFYYAIGSGESILDLVTAYDQADGDLSDRITVSEDIRNITDPADKVLTLSVTDSCGLTATESINVHIDTPEGIQELIGSREISRSSDYILGGINIYDIGMFSSQSIEETLMDVTPTIVDIRINEKNGTITTGSGFIIQITDNMIYIVTNEHVVNENIECDVCFYTGDHVTGKVVGVDDDYDVAVIKVSLSALPDSYDELISTVHIDMTYWDQLSDEPIELGLEKMARDGTIEHYTYGTLVRKIQNFAYFVPHIQTEMALALHRGDSGSAIFDAAGRLIGMAFAYSVSPERDWAVPLNEIVSAYEEITGNTLYTY